MRNYRRESLLRGRVGLYRKIAKLEPRIAAYRRQLAEIEAVLAEQNPELPLQGEVYRPNGFFAHGEMGRLVLTVLREAGESLPVRVIVLRMLESAGHEAPASASFGLLHKRVQHVLRGFDKRGVTVKVGEGRRTKRGLVMFR